MTSRVVAIVVVCVLLAAAAFAAGRESAPGAARPTDSCGISYGADGDAGPLFCRVVNAPALAYYRGIFPALFALGPYANPSQVIAALHRGKYSTIPINCSAATLATWINRWRFGLDVTPECNVRILGAEGR